MIQSSNARLVVVRNGVLVKDDRIAANPNDVGITPGFGVFTAFPGEASEVSCAVWIVPEQNVPGGVIALSDSLADRLGLSAASRETWCLEQDGFNKEIISEVTLEITVEKGLEQAARELSESRDLEGRFLYVTSAESSIEQLLEVDGTPYRIRQLKPVPMSRSVFVVAANQTRISVFAPGNRTGVDVVILADCSGSMGIDDLTEVAEAPPSRSLFGSVFGSSGPSPRPIQRARALQKSLFDLLDRRLRIVGSTSRIALVAFGHSSELRFPRPGSGVGMIEIDENTPAETVRQFKDTIATLKPENWNTNIGQALQFAASHIAQFGKPNNERLIVLISDGAAWKARGDDAVGELVDNALEEPVSLMEHLHESMGIYLHAIGISNPEVFERYLRRPGINAAEYGVGHRPNHQLLERLVQVGGGDPTRTGDAAVLDEYLQGLGTGVTRSVHVSAHKVESLTLSPKEKEQIAAAAADNRVLALPTQDDVVLRSYCAKLQDLYEKCNHYCLAHCGDRLFNPSTEAYSSFFTRTVLTPATSQMQFKLFISDLYGVFDEGLISSIRQPKPSKPLPDILLEPSSLFHEERFGSIATLRNKLLHDSMKGESSKELFQVYERLIGRRAIPSDDSDNWQRLQKTVLEELSTLLSDVLRSFESANAAKAPEDRRDRIEPIIKW